MDRWSITKIGTHINVRAYTLLEVLSSLIILERDNFTPSSDEIIFGWIGQWKLCNGSCH